MFDPCVKDCIFTHNPDLFDTDWTEGCHSALVDFLEKNEPLSTLAGPVSVPSTVTGDFLDNDDGILGHSGASSTSHGESSAKNELQCYLGVDLIHLQDDLLLWWKRNEAFFPQVAAGAKTYLAIPG